MTIITGEREVQLKFDQFPEQARARLYERITAITDDLRGRIEAAAPVKTGKLRTEIAARIFNEKNRIAGYVSVYAPGAPLEYPKAATLEYGTNKPRHAIERIVDRMGKARRRILGRISKPVHIEPFRYLRGPFEDMVPDITTQLQTAVDEAAAE